MPIQYMVATIFHIIEVTYTNATEREKWENRVNINKPTDNAHMDARKNGSMKNKWHKKAKCNNRVTERDNTNTGKKMDKIETI